MAEAPRTFACGTCTASRLPDEPCPGCGDGPVPVTFAERVEAMLGADPRVKLDAGLLEDAVFVERTMHAAVTVCESVFGTAEGEPRPLDPDVLFDVYDRLERRERIRKRAAAVAEVPDRARLGGL